jgi:ribonuclease D
MQLISTTAHLAAICADYSSAPFVTVDTEFMRESTYYPRLCLIQIAGPNSAVAVDPMADGIDLAPFFDLMANTKVTKVFHAARQDLEIIWQKAGILPAPLFDTQVAAMVCGYGDSVSYEQLANDFARAKIDKSHRFTDWSKRPLSDGQLRYALADVTHLRDVYLGLRRALDGNGREDWIAQEMAILTSPATYETQPEDAWKRLAGRARKPRDIAILMQVAAWREREARSRDVPRQRVMKDDALIDIATAAPRTQEDLGALRSVPSGFERSRAAVDILAAVRAGIETDPATLPRLERGRRPGTTDGALEIMRLALKIIAQESGVAPKVIATSDELEEIAETITTTPLQPAWRDELFGRKVRELLSGEAAIALRAGAPTIVACQD